MRSCLADVLIATAALEAHVAAARSSLPTSAAGEPAATPIEELLDSLEASAQCTRQDAAELAEMLGLNIS